MPRSRLTSNVNVKWRGAEMTRMTMIEAVRSAMDVSMERDDDVVVFGEDVGYFGGVFRATQGLQAKYGRTRCFPLQAEADRFETGQDLVFRSATV